MSTVYYHAKWGAVTYTQHTHFGVRLGNTAAKTALFRSHSGRSAWSENKGAITDIAFCLARIPAIRVTLSTPAISREKSCPRLIVPLTTPHLSLALKPRDSTTYPYMYAGGGHTCPYAFTISDPCCAAMCRETVVQLIYLFFNIDYYDKNGWSFDKYYVMG